LAIAIYTKGLFVYSYIYNVILNRNQKGTEAEMADCIYQEKMHQNPTKKTAQTMQRTPIQHKPCTDDLRIKHHLPIFPVFSKTDHLDTIQLCGKDSRGRDKREREKRAARRRPEEQASSGSGLKTTKKNRHINFTNDYTGMVDKVLRSADDLITLMEKHDQERFEEKKYIVRYQDIWDQIYAELSAQTGGELFCSQIQHFCDCVHELIEEKSKALLFILDDRSENIQKVIGNGSELYEWLKEQPSRLYIVLNKALQIKPQIVDNIIKYLIRETGGTFYASRFPEIIHIITALLQKVQASLGVITILDPNGDISRVIAEPIDLYYLLADFPPPSLLENTLFFAHPDFLKNVLLETAKETRGVIASTGLQNALNFVYTTIQNLQGDYDLYDNPTSFMDPDVTKSKYGDAWTSTPDASGVSFDVHPRLVRPVTKDIMTQFQLLKKDDFVGFHYTTYENAISLLKSAPHIKRIGSGNGTGKGMGFYVTKNKNSLWGPVALRVYVSDFSSLPKKNAVYEQATEETEEILIFGKDEIVIPTKYFNCISVFLQQEWELCDNSQPQRPSRF